MDENVEAGDVVVSFSITDGDRSIKASQIGAVQLIGEDGDFFTTNITGATTGQILTK